jgi:hypothetical protein
VLLLVGLGAAMSRINRPTAQRPDWTPAQRAWRRKVLIHGSVAVVLGVGVFVALGVHQLVIAAILIVLGVGWYLLGRRSLRRPIDG